MSPLLISSEFSNGRTGLVQQPPHTPPQQHFESEHSDFYDGGNTTTGSMSDYQSYNPTTVRLPPSQQQQQQTVYQSRYIPPQSLSQPSSTTTTAATAFDKFALRQPPLPYPKFPSPMVSFVPDGTTEFEIFLDVQQQKIEKRRPHYLDLAKEVAKSFGHSGPQLALFDVAPTREIVKYLDFHGEFVPELCERPPQSLPVQFYIPNPDGTIPTKYFNDYVEPLLITKIIEPEMPAEVVLADLAAAEFHLEQEEKLDEAIDLLENPQKYWVVTEDNWEEALPELFSDSTIFTNVDDLRQTIKAIFAEADREDRLSKFIQERARHIDLAKIVRVKDQNPDNYLGYNYEVVTHPYFYHSDVTTILDPDEFIEGDLTMDDPDGSMKKAEKIMANLDKLHRGEYTIENYPDTDPFYELRQIEQMSQGNGAMEQWWVDSTLELHKDYGHVLSNPILQRPEFGYGTFTPDFSTLDEEIKTNPYYAKSVPGLQKMIDYSEKTELEAAEIFPNQYKRLLQHEEYIQKMWVKPDQDFIDQEVNQITPENEHFYRDRQAEDRQKRLKSKNAREKLEAYIAQDHPHMYRQWLKFLYNEHLGLHYLEGQRSTTEADPRTNPVYGEEVKQIEKLYANQFNYETQLYGEPVTLHRPLDGNLEDLEDSEIWTEYQEFDPLTGESLVDENGRLLTAPAYRARKVAEAEAKAGLELKKIEREKRKEAKKQAKIARKQQQKGNRSIFSYFFGTGDEPDESTWNPELNDDDDDDDDDDDLDEDDESKKNLDPFNFNPSKAAYLNSGHTPIPTTATTKPTVPGGPVVDSYARLDPNQPHLTSEQRAGQLMESRQLEEQREKLHRKRMENAFYRRGEFIGPDEFDLLMTSDDFDIKSLKKPPPTKLEMPDFHIDTIRRKIAIINGDIEEDEEDDPLASYKEWADPVRSENIPKSRAYKEIMRYSYDQLDRDYIRKKKAAEQKFGGGLESLELLHFIGDRYDRREENLLQRAEKTTAKFRQLDKDVVGLKSLKSDLESMKIHEATAGRDPNSPEIQELELGIARLQLKLKERFQDEELEYARAEWDGYRDKIDYLDDKYAKDPANMIKKLRRQQRMNIDYDSNPTEGENFKDAYIRERIEFEQAKVREHMEDAFEHHPSLTGTIHIKDRRDLLRLTQVLYSKFGTDTPKIREAITKLPIRFYMNDPSKEIGQTITNAYLYGRDNAGFDSFGKKDQELLNTIMDGMHSTDGFDLELGAKHSKDYDELIKILEADLLPSTIQSRVDQLSQTQEKIQLYKDIKDVDTSDLPENLQLTNSQLKKAQSEDQKLLKALQDEVSTYNKDLIGSGGEKVLDTYKQLYDQKNQLVNQRVAAAAAAEAKANGKQPKSTQSTFQDEYDRIVAQVPNYQVITPSQSTPWKRWNQRLESEGFIPQGEDDRETKRKMLKHGMKRVFPSFSDFEESDDSFKQPDPLDRVIDPSAPESLRMQKKHEAEFFKRRFGLDILTGDTPFAQKWHGSGAKDMFHPRHMLRWLKIPTKNRILGEGRSNWQDEIDYQKWLKHSLPAHRIHKKGNFWDRMMIPKPSDWIHYHDKSMDEVKELIWSEEDMASKRLRETPDTAYRVPFTRNERLYDFLGELKRQVAPHGANDPDFIANLDPMKEEHAKYFYTQHELENGVLPTDFPEDNTQHRPRYSHLEDEVEHFRREKIEDYYRHRRDIGANHLHQDRLRKDKRMATKQSQFEAAVRRERFNERALGLGSFGLDVDPDDLDKNEQWEAFLDPHNKTHSWLTSDSTKDDPTRALRRRHPDINLKDYNEWRIDGPAPSNRGPSVFDKMPKMHYHEDDKDFFLNAPVEIKDSKGNVVLRDDPLNNIDVPGVELKRYDPAFQSDLNKLTKHDFAAPDGENQNDSVYERYREDQFDRWRGKLLTQGNIAEKYNEPTPKLPRATYLLKQQAAHDLNEQATEELKFKRDLNIQEYAWQLNRLDAEETEDFRRKFHGTGEQKLYHFDVPNVHRFEDPHEDPYYDTAIFTRDMPQGEFMKQNPQFMGPRHEHHRAKPFHTAQPRPIPFGAPNTVDNSPYFIRESPIRNPVLKGEMGQPSLDIDLDGYEQVQRPAKDAKKDPVNPFLQPNRAQQRHAQQRNEARRDHQQRMGDSDDGDDDAW